MNNYYSYLMYYRLILRLYPYEYRSAYEDEMVSVFSDMIKTTRRTSERIWLSVTTLFETLPWIVKENKEIGVKEISDAPRYVKRSIIASLLLISPFFIIVGSNRFMVMTHQTIPGFVATLDRTWAIYTILLPLIALVITGVSAAKYSYRSSRGQYGRLKLTSYKLSLVAILAVACISVLELIALF